MPAKKTEINYLYFSFLFLFLITLTLSHFLRGSHDELWGMRLFFLFYALGQALLEVFCLMLIGYALHRYLPRWTFVIFTGLSFVFLLAHFADFTMVRLMDTSLSYFFRFCFGCGFDHCRASIQAMNMNTSMIATIVCSILLVPLAGMAFYWITNKISRRRPLNLSQKQIFGSVLGLSLSLLLLDTVAQPYLSGELHRKFSKTLPLGTTFLAPPLHRLPLAAPLKPLPDENEMQERLASLTLSCEKRPNIYLFVIETLRRDFIDSQTAPHLTAFAKRHLSPPMTFSNANTTNLSWYSIFHSNFPFSWTDVRDQWTRGSVPLQILKKLGYRIRVYSSADFTYFGMDNVLFGKNRSLVDSIDDFAANRQIQPCERDALALASLQSTVEKEREGTLFLVFLDSTHSEYSCPSDFPHRFEPAAVSVDYLAIGNSPQNLERLTNRYRNAIHYVDHLVGRFFDRLKQLHLYDDAVIAITGDHGEEFFEEGALFHGTHLNEWQTRVPLFYKVPSSLPSADISTHIDIFPTILHSLTGRADWSDFFDGQSLFDKKRWPYILSVQHNGSETPYEFSISDGTTRLIGRFLNPPFIHTVPGIEVLSFKDEKGRASLQPDFLLSFWKDIYEPAFDPLIQR